MKKAQSAKQKTLYFFCFLINYHCVIDAIYWYLLLPDKISSKTKTFITSLHHK